MGFFTEGHPEYQEGLAITDFLDVAAMERIEKCHEDEPGNADKQVRQVIHPQVHDIQDLNDHCDPNPQYQDQPESMLKDGNILPFAVHGHVLRCSRGFGFVFRTHTNKNLITRVC
jgi:hypothetical protein